MTSQGALPAEWATEYLGNLNVEIFDGPFGSHLKTRDYVDSGIRVIRLENIGYGRFIDEKRSFVSEEKYEDISKHTVVPGDIVFSSFVTEAIRSALVPAHIPLAVNKADCFGIRFIGETTSAKYVQLFFQSRNAFKQIEGMIHGVGRPRINTSQLKQLVVPLAPKREQMRIVAKVEELFSELDKGAESLSAAHEQLKAYRQAVLKDAFKGKLTEDWRAKNASQLLAGRELLEVILKERSARRSAELELWRASVEEWEAARKKGPKPTKPAALHESEADWSSLPHLPNSWTYAPFGAVAYSVRNGISKKPNETGQLRIFRISAVRPMMFDMSDFRRIDADPEFQDYQLRRGDLVFTRYNGSRAYVGVAAMYRSDESFVYPDKLIRCDVKSRLIDPSYIEKAVNCGESRSFIESRIRTTAGQAGISGADLKSMPVPLCSIEEQMKINQIVEAQLSGIAELMNEVESALARVDALRQLILNKAFSGLLVAQDQNDEPACVLLERIHAEREGAPKKKARKDKNGRKEAA
jgi:type I restriction enzyme, S subunit